MMEGSDAQKLNICKPASEISALVEHNGSLYIGTNKGLILRLGIDKKTGNYVQEWPGPGQSIPIESGSVIRGLYSVKGETSHLYALICSSGSTGRLMEVLEDKIDLTSPLLDDPKAIIRARIVTVGQAFGIKKTILPEISMATAEGNRIQLYKFEKKTVIDKNRQETQIEKLVIVGDAIVDPDGDITALSINNKGVAYYSGGKYKVKIGKTQTFDISTTFVAKPQILPFDESSFIFCLPKLMLLKNFSSSGYDTSIPYNKGLPGLPNEKPITMMFYHERLVQFFPKAIVYGRITARYQEDFTLTPFTRVNIVEPYNDALVTICEDEVKLYGGTTVGTKCAMLAVKSKQLDDAITKFKKEAGKNEKEEIIDMFEYLWNSDVNPCDRINALKTLSIIQWPHDVCEVISLFEPAYVELPKKFERILLANALKVESLTAADLKDPETAKREDELKNAFCQFLESTHDTYVASRKQEYNPQIQVINSCRFQFYAKNLLTDKLEDLVNKENKNPIDDVFITKFLNGRTTEKILYPAYAIYRASKGTSGIEDSLYIWEDLIESAEKADKPWFAEKAAHTLRLIPGEWGMYNSKSESEEINMQRQLFDFKVKMIQKIANISPSSAVEIFKVPGTNILQEFDLFTYVNGIYKLDEKANQHDKDTDKIDCHKSGLAFGVYDYVTKTDSEEGYERLRSIKTSAIKCIIVQFCNLMYSYMRGDKINDATSVFLDGLSDSDNNDIKRLNFEKLLRKITSLIKIVDVRNQEALKQEILDNGGKYPKKNKHKEETETNKDDNLIRAINVLKGNLSVTSTRIFELENYLNVRQNTDKPFTEFKNTIVLLYCVAKEYMEGIHYIIKFHYDKMEKNVRGAITECLLEIEEFCRNSCDPEPSFTALMNLIGIDEEEKYRRNANLSEKLVPDEMKKKIRESNEFTAFLLRNFEWINMKDLIEKLISDDMPLDKCADIFRVAEAVINEKERMARMKYDIARSLNIDAKYRRVLQERRNVEIHVSTLCKKCGKPVGSGMICISPTNDVYHIPCAKGLGIPLDEYEQQYL